MALGGSGLRRSPTRPGRCIRETITGLLSNATPHSLPLSRVVGEDTPAWKWPAIVVDRSCSTLCWTRVRHSALRRFDEVREAGRAALRIAARPHTSRRTIESVPPLVRARRVRMRRGSGGFPRSLFVSWRILSSRVQRSRGHRSRVTSCESRDSNPDAVRRQILSLLRLPVPPLPRLRKSTGSEDVQPPTCNDSACVWPLSPGPRGTS